MPEWGECLAASNATATQGLRSRLCVFCSIIKHSGRTTPATCCGLASIARFGAARWFLRLAETAFWLFRAIYHCLRGTKPWFTLFLRAGAHIARVTRSGEALLARIVYAMAFHLAH